MAKKKLWQDLTIADNFIFGKVLENDPATCKLLLETTLGFKIDSIGERLLQEFAFAGIAGAVTFRNGSTVTIIDNYLSLILNERSCGVIIIKMLNPVDDRAGSGKSEYRS